MGTRSEYSTVAFPAIVVQYTRREALKIWGLCLCVNISLKYYRPFLLAYF